MKNYENYSREDLLNEIKKLKKQKKYGLVWEKEKTIENLNNNDQYPLLEEDKKKNIQKKKDQKYNFIIEGDNLHTLSVLNYSHKGKFDVIYIDPPYNTGAKDWRYNNDYVDKNDTYRHSKWLNMMEKRLLLAKPLLKDDGVLICAIDENEFNRLGLLLEEVFGDKEIHCITIVHNPRGVQGKNFSYTHEYAYFVLPITKNKIINYAKKEKEDIDWRNLRDNGGGSLRTDAKNCFYPIIIENEKIIGFGEVITDPNFHPEKQTLKKGKRFYVYPIDPKKIERKWRYARQSVEKIKDLLRIKKLENSYEIEIGKNYETLRTVWQNKKYDANEYGKKIVNALVKNDFPYPKSLFNVYDCIKPVIEDKKNALILDFFAGSGTTAHAVMLMNKEDEGKRNFILCTNNENNIADKVCYERIKNVITGNKKYPEITDINSNLKYLKVNFIKKSLSPDQLKKEITNKCKILLCFKENIFNLSEENDFYSIYNFNDKYLAIYHSPYKKKYKAFIKKLEKIDCKKIIYLFSFDYHEIDYNDFEKLKDFSINEIPNEILKIYKRIYDL